MEINLSNSDFLLLLKSIAIVKDQLNDLVVRNGIIRRFSDNTQCIYKIDLTNIINQLSMSISNCSSKLKLLEILSKQKKNIIIISDENNISFIEESGSNILIRNIDSMYTSDLFIEEDSFNNSLGLENCTKIFEFNLEEIISEKISKFSNQLNSQHVNFIFRKEEVDIQVNSMDNASNVSINIHTLKDSDIITQIEGEASFSVQPFIGLFNSKCVLYKDTIKDRLVLEVNGNLDKDDKIKFGIWGIGVLKK